MDRNRTKASAGKEAEPLPQIVFATAYDQYAVRAFDVNAVDYLLKPFDRTRVRAGCGAGAGPHGRRLRPTAAAPAASRRSSRSSTRCCSC